MGEYVEIRGERVKIGTCESMYYARVEQFRELAALGVVGHEESSCYLAPENGFRWRFPFPDEDSVQIGHFDPYNRGVTVGVPRGSRLFEGVNHEQIYKSVSCHNAYNVNVRIPCPATGLEGLQHSPIPPNVPLEIVQVKPMPDKTTWTVVRCGWCESMWRIDEGNANELVNIIREQYANRAGDAASPFWLKIADRILAGYAV